MYEIWENIWKHEKISEWNRLCQIIFEVLQRELKSFEGKRIIEAGCGSGRVSLRLAQHGADVYLLDICKEAVKYAKNISQKKKLNANVNIIRASIFNIPFRDDCFDIVWNAGVLEHFLSYEQLYALKEMKRTCKNGGSIIIMVPYSKAVFYRVGKFYQERRRRWKWGYERPFKTLRQLYNKAAIHLKREFNVGFEEQLAFIFCIPGMGRMAPLLRKLKRPLFILGIGGYLLIAIGIKLKT
ncbi:MAG: class I SAM-dependent methyltransferase [Candidatus Bathyarchaeia archaeon]